MKQLYLILFAMAVCCFTATGQVENGGFEERVNSSYCPSGPFNMVGSYPASNWRVLQSADYYHSCATNTSFKPGQSTEPVRDGGNAYAGIIAYWNPGSNYQEYLIQDLPADRKLTAGKRYKVEFWVSLSNGSNYSVSSLGMYLAGESEQLPTTSDGMRIKTPQIKATSFINNRSGWTKISGYVTPTVNINKIVIGNFNKTISSATHRPESGGCGSNTSGDCSNGSVAAYYYVDDVKIEEDCTAYGYMQGEVSGWREDFGYWDPSYQICPGETMTFQVSEFPGATDYRWVVDGLIVSGQGTRTVRVRVPSFSGFGGVANVYVTNSCGIESTVLNAQASYYIGDCGGGGTTTLALYPNPATESITIEDAAANEEFEVKLYNNQGILKRSVTTKSKKTSLDVSKLPKGVYYLHFIKKGIVEKRQVLIK